MKTIRLMTLLAVVFFTSGAQAQTEEIFYTPKLPQVEISEAKTTLARILKRITIEQKTGEKTISYSPGLTKGVRVYDDRIEIFHPGMNFDISFSAILNQTIVVRKGSPVPGVRDQSYYRVLKFGDFTLYGSNPEDAMELADYLFFFQQYLHIQPMEQQYKLWLAQWIPIAAQYCALKIKPPVTEEQRKFIVQANSFTEEKQYVDAIELYKKAIAVDQTSYPAAYSNLALLSAQLLSFDAAIYYMKIYMMLEPEAPDARGAQDKIYVWEAKLDKQ